MYRNWMNCISMSKKITSVGHFNSSKTKPKKPKRHGMSQGKLATIKKKKHTHKRNCFFNVSIKGLISTWWAGC